MVLMLLDGGNMRFFVLSHDRRADVHRFSLHPWRADAIENIEADGGVVSDLAVQVVSDGVPLPQDDALFGWRHADAITALVVFYTTYAPAYQEPSWAVMPLAGVPEAQWPPFTGERLFGYWFWENYRAGNVVSVDGLVARTSKTVFWVGTQAILGSDSCAVAHDIWSPEGYVLRRGRYVYHQALRTGKPVPTLEAMLADGKVDLAPRFQRFRDDES
jgi:hypothetical protein